MLELGTSWFTRALDAVVRGQRDKGGTPYEGGNNYRQGNTKAFHVRLTLRMSAADTHA